MTNALIQTVFLGLAFVAIPASYLALCVWMFFRRAHWFSYLAHFFLFGTIGGWCLGIALLPGGLAALCAIYLLLTSPACLLMSLFLQFRRDRNRFDTAAMFGGYIYSLLVFGPMLARKFFRIQ